MYKAGVKQPVILSVGRFFDPTQGHSKKRLELVGPFDSSTTRVFQGWTLHLVGGCGSGG